MAKRPDITTVASGYYGREALNDNFQEIQSAFDNTLSLDGSTPNAMQGDLDLNGFNLANAGGIIIGGQNLTSLLTSSVSSAATSAAQALTFSNNSANSATASAASAVSAATDAASAATSWGYFSPYTTEITAIGADLLDGSFVAGDIYDFGSITTPTTGTSGSPDGFIVSVYNNLTDIQTVAGIESDVTTVAADEVDIGTVAGLSTEVTALGPISADITTAAANTANITTVATNDANITTVAGISTDVTTVSGISPNVTTVAGISADVTAVAGDATDIGTVSTNIADVSTVAGIASDIGIVAGNDANVTAVGTDIANVNTVATNMADVNSFGETYRIGATDPTDSLDVGDLFFNSTTGVLKVYDGIGWTAGVTAGSGFLALTGGTLTGALLTTSTIDGRDVAADGTKLDGIEAAATADQTGAEIKTAYEAEADTNAFTDAEKAKLGAIEASATADQTGAEIKAAYEGEADTNAFTDAEKTKLGAIAASATNYADADVDTHLNTSTATSSEFLSWNGSDYAWATPTDTNTTYSAGSGLDLTGTTFSVESDLRGEVFYIGRDNSDYFGVEATQMNFVLDGNTDMRLYNNGDLHVDGNVIAYSSTISDERLKTDIVQIDGALDKLNQLNGYTFTYTADGKKSAGVIAQEVEKVLPSAITESTLPLKTGDDETEYKTVQYDQLIGLLVEAVKELKAEVTELRGK